jgi:threonine/homoserine/homoserine lactone efflux protein
MPDASALSFFIFSAFVLAITPGPGMLYVLTRSIKGGRSEGYASSVGTAFGGLFHVVAAALGISAILAASSIAYTLVKYVGAGYLIYLGIRTLMKRDDSGDHETTTSGGLWHALRQGIITEVLNPKTALFFLAFIPQFINPQGSVPLQFVILGTISVMLNTSADIVVATLAGPIGNMLQRRRKMRQAQRIFSGTTLIALGVYAAASGEKS